MKKLTKLETEKRQLEIGYLRDIEKLSFVEIGKRFNIHHATAIHHYKKYVDKFHIDYKHSLAPDNTELIEKVRKMHIEGYTLPDIANACGTNIEFVRRHCADLPACILPYSQRPKWETKVKPKGKYDHLWMEPRREGKMYAEYCAEQGIKVPEETAL